MPSARFIVSGRVQGVFYRASTREQALRLGLAGHAKNRVDGCVEVLASGETEALDALERWLLQGPPAARVETVEREDLPEPDLSGHELSGQDLHGFHTR
ncbi:MAG: acylphosphatase [Lysobacterales bacterium]|jgi:acylphosphatase